MNISDYPFGTKSKDKIIDNLSLIIKTNDHYKITPLHKIRDKHLDEFVNMFHKVVLLSMNDAMEEQDDFKMFKMGNLKIKDGNRLAYKIRDDLARENGYDSYADVPRKEREDYKADITKRIRTEKVTLKINKAKSKTNANVILDIKKINKLRK